tara:strand:- start:164 stop:553 length:390 start_codon:yes stop_codon:yes gene_type:complete
MTEPTPPKHDQWTPTLPHSEGSILCVWPAAVGTNEEMLDFMTLNLNVDIIPVGTVTTDPDETGPGGRMDAVFWLNCKDISRFAVPRFQFGIRWFEDVVGNEGHLIYPADFLAWAPEDGLGHPSLDGEEE